jgi:SAM-dependent methyltransferase
MSEADPLHGPAAARSFGAVADAYDRARPSYPDEAAAWLVGRPDPARPALVLELGAGTGKLTEVLARRGGHDVLATDPLPDMLRRLAVRVRVPHVVAGAEAIPLPSRSADAVVCGQSFHWFDHEAALPEIARVLRPGGHLALAWNTYDADIPWVRRLRDLLAPDSGDIDESARPMLETPYFGFVEQATFRFWQPHTAATLADLARSVSHVAIMDERERAAVLEQVDALYAEYGRGHDGMQVPYLTRCYRAVVRHEELPVEVPLTPVEPAAVPGEVESGPPVARRPPEDPGMQLIDFR